MKSRILSRKMLLVVVLASIVVVLFTSGAFAQRTASIKALFTTDTPAATVAPAAVEQPASPRQ